MVREQKGRKVRSAKGIPRHQLRRLTDEKEIDAYEGTLYRLPGDSTGVYVLVRTLLEEER